MNREAGLPSISLSCTVCSHLHSSAHGDALTRGGLISTDSAASRPTACISSTPRGKVRDVSLTCSRKSQTARLHTNSRVSSTKSIVFFLPSLANITIGGSLETLLKNEYGARLISPFMLIEVIHPIGRGAMMAVNGSCGRPWSFLVGS